jgi:hypothetical protein
MAGLLNGNLTIQQSNNLSMPLDFEKQSINHLIKRERTACGAECSGGGGGCG